MARALVVTGLDPERAYLIARRADRDLTERGAVSLDLDRLGELAAELIGEEEAARTVRRLRRLDALQRLDEPLLLLVGGATGTGKSTIATEAAHRLGITRVTSTDFIRQTMRTFFSQGVHAVRPLLELRGAPCADAGGGGGVRRRCDPRLSRSDAERSRRRGRGARARGDGAVVDGARGRPPRARHGRHGVSRRIRRPVRGRDRGREPAPQSLLGARPGDRGSSPAREVPRFASADPRDPGLPRRARPTSRRAGDLQRLARPGDRGRARPRASPRRSASSPSASPPSLHLPRGNARRRRRGAAWCRGSRARDGHRRARAHVRRRGRRAEA